MRSPRSLSTPTIRTLLPIEGRPGGRTTLAVLAVLLAVMLAGCGGGHKLTPLQKLTQPTKQCPDGPLYRPCGPHVKGWAVPPKTFSAPAPIRGVLTREMFDTIEVGTVPTNPVPWAVAGYTSGFWPTFGPLVRAFPGSHVLSIAINLGHDANCLDVEPGDASISQGGPWAKRQLQAGHGLVCEYTSVSNMGALKANVAAWGIPTSRVRWWCAWYRYIPGLVSGCDAVQWTDHAFGRNLDESTVRADFFGPVVPPGPSPATIRAWRKAREDAFSRYRQHRCSSPQTGNETPAGFGVPNVCRDQAALVVGNQTKLWAVYRRWPCFGPGAQTKSEVCWIVRPQAAYWSRARAATGTALRQHSCVRPYRRTVCKTLGQRYTWFDQHASGTVREYS